MIIGVFLVLLRLDYHYPAGSTKGIWLLPVAVLISAMMVQELLSLWGARADRPTRWPVYVAAPLVVVGAGLPLVWQLPFVAPESNDALVNCQGELAAMVIGIGLVFVGEMLRYTQPGESTGRIALSFLAIAYAGVLVGFLVKLRLVGESAQQDWGMAALFSMVLIVKLSDAAAFFAGRQFGKHKMAPRLSPAKTMEGAAAALAMALLAACICYIGVVPALVGPNVPRGPFWGWLLFGALVAVAGMVGDLAESLLKRDAKRKDSSSWLPGLGGVLDILDSIVFAAVPAYYCFASGLIGPVSEPF